MEGKRRYKFVRIGKKNTDEYGEWFFEPLSIDDVNEHWRLVCCPEISEGVKRLTISVLKRGCFSHSTNSFGIAVEAFCKATNQTYALGCLHIENESYKNRVRDINEGKKIYLPERMTILMLDERFFEIKETAEKDSLVYPTKDRITIKDVRYMQWNMLGNTGNHWYAKIGSRDIYDDNGNMKWDSKEDAEKAAKWFIDNVLK